MSHKGQEKSIVWHFFTINDEDKTKVMCNLCQKVLSRGGKTSNTFTTTNMNKHLKGVHKEEFEAEEAAMKEAKQHSAAEKEKRVDDYFTVSARKKIKLDQQPSVSGSSSNSQSQLTLKESIALKKIWDINSPQSVKIHYAIGEMIAVDSQPFSIVEDLGFTRLMKLTKPCYELPSRKYFTQKIIPDIHSKVLSKVESILIDASHMSFTTDIWTNNADASFIR